VEIVAIDVEASVDLRDVSAVKAVGIDLEDALAPRQRIAEGGGRLGHRRCVTASSKSVPTA